MPVMPFVPALSSPQEVHCVCHEPILALYVSSGHNVHSPSLVVEDVLEGVGVR